MKHLKKFENSTDENYNPDFTISEISDIINEFADSFEIQEDDINILYRLNMRDNHISLNELRKDATHLKFIENLLEIIIHFSNKDYTDFIEECNENIKMIETLKSLSGKIETLGCYIIPNSLDISSNLDYDTRPIILSIRKEK